MRTWTITPLKERLFKHTDTTNSGVLVATMLCSWRYGIPLGEFNEDVIKYRREFLIAMQDSLNPKLNPKWLSSLDIILPLVPESIPL